VRPYRRVWEVKLDNLIDFNVSLSVGDTFTNLKVSKWDVGSSGYIEIEVTATTDGELEMIFPMLTYSIITPSQLAAKIMLEYASLMSNVDAILDDGSYTKASNDNGGPGGSQKAS